MSDWPEFDMVVAWADLSEGRVIGFQGAIPWHLRSDLKRFKRITTAHLHNAVIMGRKTWESLPEGVRPLPGRHNVILTRQKLDLRKIPMGQPGHVTFATNLDEAFEACEDSYPFIIGGSEIYAQTINSSQLVRIHQTVVRDLPTVWKTSDAESLGSLAFFPPGPIKGHWRVTHVEEGLDAGMRYRYEILKRHRS